MSRRVFINYRRSEDWATARLVYNTLEQHFSRDHLFMDVDNIPLSSNFVEVIEEHIAQCEVFLSVIGKRWVDLKNDKGERRLDKEKDYVRIEIESALKLGKIIIPVLIDEAVMPDEDVLPAPLKPLAHLNALKLTHVHWNASAIKLIEGIKGAVQKAKGRRGEPGDEPPPVVVAPPPRRVATPGSSLTVRRKAARASAAPVLRHTLTGHYDQVTAVAITPDGQSAVSGSHDKSLKLWDLLSGREVGTLTGHTDWIRSVAITPDGRTALSGSDDSTLKLWNLQSRREVRTLTHHRGSVRSVAVLPEGRIALSVSRDKTMKVWDLAQGQELRTLACDKGDVFSVAIYPDGRTALSGGEDKDVTIWDLPSSRRVRSLGCANDATNSASATPNGQAKVLERDGPLSLQNWYMPARSDVLTCHGDWVTSVAISPDGRLALSGSDDCSVKVWDLTTCQLVRTLAGHTRSVHAVAIAPDARIALSASADGTVKVWDLTSGCELWSLSGHSDHVLAVAIAPDGRTVVSGSRDRSLKVWDLTSA